MSRKFRIRTPWLITIAVLAAAVLWAGVPSAQATETLKQTYTFQPPVLNTMQHENISYTSISSPGTMTMGKIAGTPAMPVKFVQILLPLGREVVNVEVTGILKSFDTDSYDLTTRPIFPYQRPVPIGNAPQKKLAFDQAVYSSYTPYPAEDFSGEKVGFCRGYTIYSMGLNPVKYVPASGQLSYYTEMTVSIEMKDTGEFNSFLRSDNTKDRAWVQKLVSNPEMTTSYQEVSSGKAEYPGGLCDPADNYDYVIITTTQNGLNNWNTSGTLPYNWQSLMDKHATVSGLSCTLVTIQQITPVLEYQNSNPLFNDNQARIREFCKDAYQDWGTDYILIGGDAEWIPARLMDYQYESDVDSDIYWNHLDSTFNNDGDSYWGEVGDTGFDLYAEMYIGRITADVPQDVSNWLKKCFYYMDSLDPDYIDNAAFYGGDTGWNCEGDDFIDYSAIQGLDHWLGPDPSVDPYPAWLGFQYGFETWNSENPASAFNLDVKWTAEPPNAGWAGGSSTAAINGLRNAISNDQCTLISCIAHANEYMAADVSNTEWESSYHNTKPFFLHDYGCHCGDMNAADDGVLHSMLLHSDTELAFACVFNTGYGWGNFDNSCSSSSVQQKSFWDYMFDVTNNSQSCDNWQLGKAMAFARDLMAPTIDWDPDYGTWRGIIQSCLLFGDPALKIRPPAEPAFFVSFPEGLPSGSYPPGLENTVTVQIINGEETYVPGSGLMYYRFDSNNPFSTVALTAAGGNLYEGVLPNTRPGDEPEFYFYAEGDGGTSITLPAGAPADTYKFDVYFVELMLADNFETETGWTVANTSVTTGAWERANPAGTDAQLEDDHSDPGTQCFVTGPLGGSIGDYDLDGGPTRLTSPVFDLSSGDAEISFYLYFYHSTNGGQLPLEIDITNNGLSWTRVANVTHSPAWNLKSIRVSDYVTPTANIQLRFSANDNPNDSVVEAMLDDLSIQRYIFDASLWADAYSIQVSTGKQVSLDIDAGAGNSGRPYLLLGTLSGTSPVYTLPGGAVLPLNWDAFTDLLLAFLNTAVCQNFYNTLDGMGQATAALDTFGPLDPALIGETANFAFTLGNPFDFASNPIAITFEP
ncbi:MAG: C25 family cysteine peptidase [Planctomycetota bacterium]